MPVLQGYFKISDYKVTPNQRFSKKPFQRVPYTSSENTLMQKYLAFSRIPKNSKNSFTFTEKSKQSRFT